MNKSNSIKKKNQLKTFFVKKSFFYLFAAFLAVIACKEQQSGTEGSKIPSTDQSKFYKLAENYAKLKEDSGNGFHEILTQLDAQLKAIAEGIVSNDPNKSNYATKINEAISASATDLKILKKDDSGQNDTPDAAIDELGKLIAHITSSAIYVAAQVELWKDGFDTNGKLKDEENRGDFDVFIKKTNKFLDAYRNVKKAIEAKMKEHQKAKKENLIKEAFLLEGEAQANFKKAIGYLKLLQGANEEKIKELGSKKIINDLISKYRELNNLIDKVKPYQVDADEPLSSIKANMDEILAELDKYNAEMTDKKYFSDVENDDSDNLLKFEDAGHLKLKESLRDHLVEGSFITDKDNYDEISTKATKLNEAAKAIADLL